MLTLIVHVNTLCPHMITSYGCYLNLAVTNEHCPTLNDL